MSEPQTSKPRVTITDSQVGVVGDHAHVEGGTHFDQEGQQIQTQVNIGTYYASGQPLPPLSEGRHDFYRHISMPDHYISRPEALDALREALTSAVKVALHGMGGIGKSVLARALCDDPAVQAAFPDGILWTTLGRTVTEPELRSKLREWVETLGGIISENAPTLDQLKNRLAQLLEARACLLIVDDAWQHTHAAAFQVGGARCRLLLTTRDAEVARAVGATIHPVETLPSEQAVALLQEWAQGNLTTAVPDVLDQIVKRLGCLPLALKLAGAQLRDKDPARWLETFGARKLKARRSETLHDNLEQTLVLSLDTLPLVDRHCYTALAIFKEDEPIPLCALTKLWRALEGLDADESVVLLNDLAARALLQLSARHSIEHSDEESQITLHDLLRDFIIAELGEAGALAGHRVLLDAYHATRTGEGWHTAPDDGYLYAHLAYHLYTVNDNASLNALFANDAWLHARVPVDGYTYDGYLDDLTLAWRHARDLATRQIADELLPLAVVDCIHYALISTSVNELAGNYEPVLVARAVDTGLWSPERGLSIARRIVDAKKQIQMVNALLRDAGMPNALRVSAQRLALNTVRETDSPWFLMDELIPQLMGDMLAEGLEVTCAIQDEGIRGWYLEQLSPQIAADDRCRELLTKALAAARAIESEMRRAKALTALAPQLTDELLEEGLAAACAIESEGWRAVVLTALAPQLTDELRDEGLAAARLIEDEGHRARALSALASQLTGAIRPQVLTEALAMTRTIENERCRVEVLMALAPQLTDELLAEGLAVLRTTTNEKQRARILVTLAAQSTGITQEQILAEGLAAARAIADEEGRARALAALASQFTEARQEQILTEALAMTRTIENERCRVEVLMALAPQLTDELLAEGLAVLRTITNEEERARILVTLAAQSTGTTQEQILAEGIAAARTIVDEERRARAFAALALQLIGPTQERILTEALKAARKIADKERRVKVLVTLAMQFTGAMREQILAEGLAIARTMRNNRGWMQSLASLAPQLTEIARKQILTDAHTVKDEWSKVQIVVALATQLRDDSLMEGLTVARAIENECYRTYALSALVSQLSSEARKQASTEIISATRTIEHEGDRATILAKLAPNLTEDLLLDGLAAARAIRDEGNRAEVLTTLAPLLRGDLLTDGLAAAHTIRDEGRRAKVLMKLAPSFTGTAHMQVLKESLAAVHAIADSKSRTNVLETLVPQLATDDYLSNLLREEWKSVHTIEDDHERAIVLAILAPYLTGDLVQECLTEACALQYREELQAVILRRLAPKLEGELLRTAIAPARTFELDWGKAQVLAALASQLAADDCPGGLLEEGLAITRAMKREDCQAKVLTALALQFSGPEREKLLLEGLTAARAISYKKWQVEALVALVPHFSGTMHELLLTEGLVAARMITDVKDRLRSLVALAAITDVPATISKDIRWALLNCLWEFRDCERQNLLKLLTNDDMAFLRALVLSEEAYAQIAQSIIDICTKWDWI